MISRRGFILLPVGAFLVGCEKQSRYKNRQQDKPGPHASNKDRKDNRKYPCGNPKLGPTHHEYTVVTTPRYTVYVNGRPKKVNKVYILCGDAAAEQHRNLYPFDLVYRSG